MPYNPGDLQGEVAGTECGEKQRAEWGGGQGPAFTPHGLVVEEGSGEAFDKVSRQQSKVELFYVNSLVPTVEREES